jgi:glycosyltransferase involved in cell wall biosynthesis
MRPRISIVTPSFRSSKWLKLCIPSVADQGVPVEHIVQDSCSDDGTQDWLPKDSRVQAFIEKDRGMYDAVNRGLRRAQGEIVAYLNCDEQYLPGALAAVSDYFDRHSSIEVLFADTIVVDGQGDYICHRQSVLPYKWHCMVSDNLACLTSSIFFRRSVIERRRLFFNERLRDIGDAHWVIQLIEHDVPIGLLQQFTSTFTETGVNMNLMPNAQREKAELFARAPALARYGRHLVIAHHRVRRLLAGHYWHKPFAYALYTEASPDRRVEKAVSNPTYRWKR